MRHNSWIQQQEDWTICRLLSKSQIWVVWGKKTYRLTAVDCLVFFCVFFSFFFQGHCRVKGQFLHWILKKKIIAFNHRIKLITNKWLLLPSSHPTIHWKPLPTQLQCIFVLRRHACDTKFLKAKTNPNQQQNDWDNERHSLCKIWLFKLTAAMVTLTKTLT